MVWNSYHDLLSLYPLTFYLLSNPLGPLNAVILASLLFMLYQAQFWILQAFLLALSVESSFSRAAPHLLQMSVHISAFQMTFSLFSLA